MTMAEKSASSGQPSVIAGGYRWRGPGGMECSELVEGEQPLTAPHPIFGKDNRPPIPQKYRQCKTSE
jgi:hypothetical protein